jgi:hypothetical protein
MWRVSWNTGSGELYAARLDASEVQVLGLYDSVEAVAAALPGWGQRGLRPGGLDWVRERTRDFGVGVAGGQGGAARGVVGDVGWLRGELARQVERVDRGVGLGLER